MHKVLRRSLVLTGFVGLLSGAKVFTLYWDFPAAASELPQAIRDYRAQGLPWTAADLERHVPDAENAAPWFRKAFAAMPDEKTQKEFSAAIRYGGAERYFPAFERSLYYLHQGAKFPKLDYHRDWDQGPQLLLPEPSKAKLLSRVLAARALREAELGKDSAALEDLEEVRRVTRLIGQEATLLDYLAAVACEANGLAVVERSLASAANDIPRLERYRRWLENAPPILSVREPIRNDVYNLVALTRNLDRFGGMRSFNPLEDFNFLNSEEVGSEIPADKLRRDGFPPQTRGQAYMARVLQAWTEFYRQTNELRVSEKEYCEIADAISDRIGKRRGLSYQMGGLIMPTFGQAYQTPLAELASRRKTLALADALITRARTGAWPKKSGQIDPLSGKPLRMRFDGKRLRIWSVGRNGIDEGGLTRPEASDLGKQSDDLVAVFPPFPPPSKSLRALSSSRD